jgi:hypothetical protein
MRLLLITHYFWPDSGAAAVRLTRLARGLVAGDFAHQPPRLPRD